MTQAENDWWNNLEGEDVYTNAFGLPHYDVEAVADYIEDYIRFHDNKTYLDIGCGPGRLTNLLASRYPNSAFIGIDVASNMIALAEAESHLNTMYMTTNGNYVPTPSPLYSGVYSVTVFQHIPHDAVQNYVHLVYERLVPNGKFIFTYAQGTDDGFLSHQMSKETVTEILEHAGFHVTHLHTPSSHPTWSWVLGIKEN